MRRYPDVRVSFFMTQRAVDIVAEGFDVALRGCVLSDSGLVARKIADSDLVLCAAPDYLDARGRPESPADLAEHDGVLMGTTKPASLPWEGPNGRVVLPLEPRILANEWGFLHSALRAGLGIGPLLLPDVRDDLATGRLERVLPEHTVRSGGLFAVYPSRHHLTPKVRVFVDYLIEKLGGDLGPARP